MIYGIMMMKQKYERKKQRVNGKTIKFVQTKSYGKCIQTLLHNSNWHILNYSYIQLVNDYEMVEKI